MAGFQPLAAKFFDGLLIETDLSANACIFARLGRTCRMSPSRASRNARSGGRFHSRVTGLPKKLRPSCCRDKDLAAGKAEPVIRVVAV